MAEKAKKATVVARAPRSTTKATKSAKAVVAKPTKPVVKSVAIATVANPKKPATAWDVVVKHLVHNIMKNATYVTDACKCKTVTESHLKAVALIQSNIAKQGIAYVPSKSASAVKGRRGSSGQRGGAVLMPSEYFSGVSSGRYLDIAQVNPNEVQLFANSSLARAEHPIKIADGAMSGGARGGPTVTASAVKAAIKADGSGLRVAKPAMALIVASVQANVNELAETVDKSATNAQIMDVINTHPKFLHLKI